MRKHPHSACLQRNPISMILGIKHAGCEDINTFPFITPPPTLFLTDALAYLICIGALEPQSPHRITRLGRALNHVACSIPLARALYQSKSFKCSDEVVVIVAMITCGANVCDFVQNWNSQQTTSDHVAMHNVFMMWFNQYKSKSGKEADDIQRRHVFNNSALRKAKKLAKEYSKTIGSNFPPRNTVIRSDVKECIEKCFLISHFHQLAFHKTQDSPLILGDMKSATVTENTSVHESSLGGHKFILYNLMSVIIGRQLKTVMCIPEACRSSGCSYSVHS